jgi:Domain of unknown function (DUF5658)
MKCAKGSPEVYELAPISPSEPRREPVSARRAPEAEAQPVRSRRRKASWRRLFHVFGAEPSAIERESMALIVLSAADVLVTYSLLRRGSAFYESNPVAQWFFVRWNIAGMAFFKFGLMGLVIAIGEVVERRRTGWGRGLLLVSCLATLVVVAHGLRLLLAYADNGAIALR